MPVVFCQQVEIPREAIVTCRGSHARRCTANRKFARNVVSKETGREPSRNVRTDICMLLRSAQKQRLNFGD